MCLSEWLCMCVCMRWCVRIYGTTSKVKLRKIFFSVQQTSDVLQNPSARRALISSSHSLFLDSLILSLSLPSVFHTYLYEILKLFPSSQKSE